MTYHVSLSSLPEGLQFPEDLKHRIWYDESRRKLVYDGFMSKEVFDRLEGLHDDFAYCRAIEELFRKAVPAPPNETSRMPLLLITGAVATLLLGVGVWWFVI